MDSDACQDRNFWIGPGVELLVQIKGVEGRFKTVTVGIEAGQYLIVQTPRVAGVESKVFTGNVVTALVVISGTVFGFRSEILNSIKNPTRLLFLTYPDAIERQELRGNQRLECCMPAVVRHQKGGKEWKGVIVDISAGGCKFVYACHDDLSRHSIEIGEKVDIACEQLGMEDFKNWSGEIRNLNHDARSTSLGIMFDLSNPNLKNKLDSYVNTVTQLLDGASAQQAALK